MELWQIPWTMHFYPVAISLFSTAPVTLIYLTSLLLVGWLMIFLSTHMIESCCLTIVWSCIKNNKEKSWRQNLVTRSTLVWILLLRLRGWIFYKQSSFSTFMSLRIRVRPLRAKNINHGERFSWPLSIFSASQPIIKVLQYTDRCTDI